MGGERYFAGVAAEDADYAGGETFACGERGETGELGFEELVVGGVFLGHFSEEFGGVF